VEFDRRYFVLHTRNERSYDVPADMSSDLAIVIGAEWVVLRTSVGNPINYGPAAANLAPAAGAVSE
jgi:hypothetical protein